MILKEKSKGKIILALKKGWKITLKIVLLSAVLAIIFIILISVGLFGHIQTQRELLNFRNAEAAIVLSEEGEVIGRFFFENRTNISYQQIPQHLTHAVIATEDARFLEHKGLDYRSFLRVLIKSVIFSDRSSGGGSTITQQLAKNMFGRRDLGFLTLPVNKTKEVILARRIEKAFTKEEILTLYLNTVSFGENVYGIEAASERFFNKKTEDLNMEESAVLTGMLKANTWYNPRLNPENAIIRRNVVLRQMQKYNYLTEAQADSLCNTQLITNYTNYDSGGPADYFLVQVRNEAKTIINDINSVSEKQWDLGKDGLIISTTLNLSLQKYALDAYRAHLPGMQKKLRDQYSSSSGKRQLNEIAERELTRSGLSGRENVVKEQYIFDWNSSYNDSITVRDSLLNALTMLHAGFLALDPLTGAVKTWVGGIDFTTQPYDQVLARRQLASVFKPILYAAALEEGFEPCHYLDNDSVILSGFDEWSPENYDHSYGGKYSLAGALVHSMNVPSFSLFLELGFTKVDSMWKKLGFSFPLDNTPSLPLGTAEASILEVAAAYASFANGGYRVDPVCIESIKAPGGQIIYLNEASMVRERVISGKTSLLMSAMLQKAAREGTGTTVKTVYGVSLPLAGKTGTSQNYADAWFAAFNPKLVIVSRAGASTPSIHFNNGSYGSGSSLALPLVALTLRNVQATPLLSEKFFAPFPELPPELLGALDCPDFREKSLFDRIIDLFEKEKVFTGKDADRGKRKRRSFLYRLFRR